MRVTNCRTRKMLKALEKNCGTISGRKLSIQPSWEKIQNCGIIVIWAGIIIVAMTTKNSGRFPGARRRAKA